MRHRHRYKQLTTAAPSVDISFNGISGHFFADGTFGGGEVEVRPVAVNDDGVKVVPTGCLSTKLTEAAPDGYIHAGTWRLTLAGSTGGDVTIYYNEAAITSHK